MLLERDSNTSEKGVEFEVINLKPACSSGELTE